MDGGSLPTCMLEEVFDSSTTLKEFARFHTLFNSCPKDSMPKDTE
jgi:hypothetical protein